MTRGERGSLVGNNPETLCVEAPKGKPMIYSSSRRDLHGRRPSGREKRKGRTKGTRFITVDKSGRVRKGGVTCNEITLEE